MRAGFLQFEPVFGNPNENISRIDRLISYNFLQPNDLLVIPELANSGYLFSSKEELHDLSEEIPDGKFCNFLRRKCLESRGYIVSGICERAGNKYFNSAILVHPDGMINTYRKIHLFYEEKLWFTPGDTPLEIFDLKTLNVRIGMMVCFDWRFPEIARTLALKGAQIICHPANLVMPHCQDAMIIRALENQVFTITANRIGKDVKKDKELAFTGKSIIVNPKGEVIYIAPENKEELFIADINPDLALDKMVTEYNNIFADRREEMYFK